MEFFNANTPGRVYCEPHFSHMDVQIHCIESEAYSSVLRAFHAQSDILSWDRFDLMSKLRNELRVNDAEHNEISQNITTHRSIVRECYKGSDSQISMTVNPPASDPMSIGYISHKRLKPAHTTVASSPKYPSHAQPSALATPLVGLVCREAHFSHMDVQIHCIESEAYSSVLRAFHAQSDILSWDRFDLLSKLRKELRINDMDHSEILQNFMSDRSIFREREKESDSKILMTVNPPSLDQISMGHVSDKRLKPAHTTAASSPNYTSHAPLAEHIREVHQRASNIAVLSPKKCAASGQAILPIPQNRQAPSCGKVRRSMQKSKKGFAHSGSENLKPDPDSIEILGTEKLIHEVGKACGGVTPDPAQVQSAKVNLKEQERALMNAIGRIADMHDSDYCRKNWRQRHSGEERERNARKPSRVACAQLERNMKHCGEHYSELRPERAGIPCINLHDGE